MSARGCRFGGFTGKVVRVTRLKAVAITLFFLALGATSVNAQAPSQVRTGGRSTLSEIAHGISNWFTRGTDTDGNRHRERSLPPPLPRPRPPELTSAPVPSNKEPSELTTSSVTPTKEPSELTAAPVPSNKEPSELTTSSVPPYKEPSELTAAPVAPKKKTPAPVLIND
jgi:hypothetical protein